MDTKNNVDLSFVIPCLNEEETIGGVIDEINNALDGSGIKYEIIVSDNGSTDKSKDISLSKGCRVVEERIHKGYGAALQKGFGAAQGEYVAFSDADGSYIVSHIKDMYKTAKEKNCDMVIASRLKGEIEESAMPFLHRYLGTPVLTFLINIFFNGRLSDCNSGFRLIRKEAYEKWNIKGMGMEFASELLVKALKKQGFHNRNSVGIAARQAQQKPAFKDLERRNEAPSFHPFGVRAHFRICSVYFRASVSFSIKFHTAPYNIAAFNDRWIRVVFYIHISLPDPWKRQAEHANAHFSQFERRHAILFSGGDAFYADNHRNIDSRIPRHGGNIRADCRCASSYGI